MRSMIFGAICLGTLWGHALEVVVSGYEDRRGAIRVGLFDSAETFAKEGKMLQGRALDLGTGVTSVIFEGLDPKAYAIAVYHDANGNAKMDRNFFGVPTEDYAFSNNAAGLFGPPPFDEAKFLLNEDRRIDIILNK